MRFCNDNFTVSKTKRGESVADVEESDVTIIDIAPREPRGKYGK